ncbi:MAG: hypothetical protein WBQ94_20490 [Terracidiphilus sp.]
MEIGPIVGIRTIPVVPTPPIEPDLAPVYDIENPARMGDDGYTPSGQEQASAEEDEKSQAESVEAADADEGSTEIPMLPADMSSQISFFA